MPHPPCVAYQGRERRTDDGHEPVFPWRNTRLKNAAPRSRHMPSKVERDLHPDAPDWVVHLAYRFISGGVGARPLRWLLVRGPPERRKKQMFDAVPFVPVARGPQVLVQRVGRGTFRLGPGSFRPVRGDAGTAGRHVVPGCGKQEWVPGSFGTLRARYLGTGSSGRHRSRGRPEPEGIGRCW